MKRILLSLCLPLCLGAALQEARLPFPETLARLRELVEQGDVEAARALGEPLLAIPTLAEPERAALHFGLGLVRARSDDHALWPEAAQAFQSARALAGAGALRLAATYDAGVVDLQEGERLRGTIPEVAQAAGAGHPAPGSLQNVPPPGPLLPPGAAAGAHGAPAEEEDPLPLARAAYERARATLCEGLRADWQDVDTRANLELVQRRLRELEEIERRREEQQEQQEEEQPSEDQKGEEGDSEGQDQEQKDPSEEDQESQGEQQQDPQGEPPPEQPGEEGEEQQEEEPEQDPAAEDPAADASQELEPPAEGEEPEPMPQAEDGERHLTREEVMRLLDRLAELEAQGRAAEARLRQARRQAVERDW